MDVGYGRKKKILIINDDENLREIFQLYLELKGFDVYQAENGCQGLEKVARVAPDLVLLDVMMPGINGYEVCKRLKQDPKTKDIPVIFLSSLLSPSDKIKGLESGGVDFIPNTADQAEILARVETHLKISALNQQLMASYQELMLKQQALNENLRAAAVIQQSLLPKSQPLIPHVKMAWSCYPSEMIGGDICNIIQIDSEKVIFYILDVSGHGVTSAMLTVSITQYLKQQNQSSNSFLTPKQALTALNREYPFEKFNMFSTIFYMIFNSETGNLSYSSAGHPPAVYLSPHRPFKLLSQGGVIIGVLPDASYEEGEEMLHPGDKIILYTDGVIEFRNENRTMYGSERLYDLLEKIKHKPITEIVQIMGESLREFGNNQNFQDDVSIIGLEFVE